MRAIAGFPGFQWPGHADWPVQPLTAEDLGALVAAAAANRAVGIYEVGGPVRMPLHAYQTHWRHWLRNACERAIRVPEALISLQVWLWERIGSGPVGETMWRMLRRGNVTANDAHARLARDFGIAPRPLQQILAATPSQTQDRWQAQLYFLAPTLRFCMAALWLLSAWAGWRTPATDIQMLVDGTALQPAQPVALARTAAVIDAALGLWLLSGRRLRLAIGFMGISVLVYTLAFGTLLPALWLDPLADW